MHIRLRLDGLRDVRREGRLRSLPLRVGVARRPDLDTQLRHDGTRLRVVGNLAPPILGEPHHVRHLHPFSRLYGELDGTTARMIKVFEQEFPDSHLEMSVEQCVRAQEKLSVSVRLNFEGEIPQLWIT